MSWIETPDESTAGRDVVELYEADRADLGYVANYTKVFAHRPQVLAAWESLSSAIRSAMGPRRYELATLAAALRLRSSYCALAHGRVLADQHLGPDVVRELATEPAAADLSPVERAVVRLADTVAAGAADMTADDLAELRSLGVPDAEVLDVVLAAAARCFFSTVLDAVGAEPDEAFTALDPRLRQVLTVGRPIAAPGGG